MKFKFNKVLITGGAGFIGSHLVDALLSEGCEVTVLDNLSTGNLSNLDHIKDHIKFYQGDIRDREILNKVAKDCDVIFHQAAVVSVPSTVDDPVESGMVNEMGTLLVLEAARKNNIKKVILASSCAVYGDDPDIPPGSFMHVFILTCSDLNRSAYAILMFTDQDRIRRRLTPELFRFS